MAALAEAAFIAGAEVAIVGAGLAAQVRVFALATAAVVVGAGVAVILAGLEVRGRRMATLTQQADVLGARITIFEAAFIASQRLVGAAALIADVSRAGVAVLRAGDGEGHG